MRFPFVSTWVFFLGLCFSSQSYATLISFDFSDTTQSQSVSTFQTIQQDLQLMVWGSQTNAGITQPAAIFQNEYGLGVLTGNRDNSEIDIYGPDESLFFEFSRPVDLVSIEFSQVGTNDAFSLLANNGDSLSADIPGGTGDDMAHSLLYFDDIFSSDSFFQLSPSGRYSEFSVANITVATVPLPASVWLLLLGLCSLAIFHHGKSRQRVPSMSKQIVSC